MVFQFLIEIGSKIANYRQFGQDHFYQRNNFDDSQLQKRWFCLINEIGCFDSIKIGDFIPAPKINTYL